MVNFPVDTESTYEGGMYVRLWVMPRKNSGLCCGTSTSELVNDIFLGTDTTKKLKAKHDKISVAKWAMAIQAKDISRATRLDQKLEQKILNKFVSRDESKRYWSHSLAASVLMGSTGWSNSEFTCTYEHLNKKGRAMYDLFKSQYSDCDLHLLTFLDT